MSERGPLFEIRDLHAGYGGKEIISGLSLSVAPGETAALLGLNGSGKSTLLRAALGLVPHASGRVLAGGGEISRLNAKERAKRIAYVPQRSLGDEGMTALEAVLLGANAHMPLLGGYSAAQRAQALACLEQLGEGDLAQRTLRTLSQGQRRLTVFARAMMQSPQVYLMDEPDGALDLQRRWSILAQIRQMTEGKERCALVALHDASAALSCCDRVMILSGGAIACALDMRETNEDEVLAAMRLLYGGVSVMHNAHGWAVVPKGIR